MKRIILLSFLTFFVGGNIFAQAKPDETFRSFWKLILSDDFESARKFVGKISQAQVIEEGKFNKSFHVIFQNKLRFPELGQTQISSEAAIFNFQITSNDKRIFKGQALLVNENGNWKVFFFDVKPATEIRQLPLLKPSDHMIRDCLICS